MHSSFVIKKTEAYNFDADWTAINLIMRPPYNVGEEQFNYSLAASLWLLDGIRANHKMDEALKILPREREKLDSVKIPQCISSIRVICLSAYAWQTRS